MCIATMGRAVGVAVPCRRNSFLQHPGWGCGPTHILNAFGVEQSDLFTPDFFSLLVALRPMNRADDHASKSPRRPRLCLYGANFIAGRSLSSAAIKSEESLRPGPKEVRTALFATIAFQEDGKPQDILSVRQIRSTAVGAAVYYLRKFTSNFAQILRRSSSHAQ